MEFQNGSLNENYFNLIKAVVERAIDDFMVVKSGGVIREENGRVSGNWNETEIVEFFKSPWGERITFGANLKILKKIRQIARRKNRPKMGRVFITGDCHGDFGSRFKQSAFPSSNLTKNDYVIVCGDF